MICKDGKAYYYGCPDRKCAHKRYEPAFTGHCRNEIPMAAAAILMGGHVRVGLEDNLFMQDRSPASNQLLVEKVVAIARELGREIATPDEARTVLSLNQN